MKDYKRLTRRINFDSERSRVFPVPSSNMVEGINRLAELEDKIENGTLVELPCKIGDELYMIQFADSTHNNDKIFKTRADGIVLFPNGSFDIILPSKHFAAWGWSVFPTKDEAEKQIEIFKKAVKMVDGKKGITLSVAVNKIKGEKQ